MTTMFRAYAFPQMGELTHLESDLPQPIEIESEGFFRCVYTTIFEYSDSVKEIAYWSTIADRWVLVEDGRTFTDFCFVELRVKEPV